jgi:hypothetical protein
MIPPEKKRTPTSSDVFLFMMSFFQGTKAPIGISTFRELIIIFFFLTKKGEGLYYKTFYGRN